VSLGAGGSWHDVQSLPKGHEDGTSISTGSNGPLPKGLISDRSVNSAGDCMVSPTTFLPTTTAPCGDVCQRKEVTSACWSSGVGRLEAEGVDRIVLRRSASSELVERNRKKSVP
jgi:hypothetical protein